MSKNEAGESGRHSSPCIEGCDESRMIVDMKAMLASFRDEPQATRGAPVANLRRRRLYALGPALQSAVMTHRLQAYRARPHSPRESPPSDRYSSGLRFESK